MNKQAPKGQPHVSTTHSLRNYARMMAPAIAVIERGDDGGNVVRFIMPYGVEIGLIQGRIADDFIRRYDNFIARVITPGRRPVLRRNDLPVWKLIGGSLNA